MKSIYIALTVLTISCVFAQPQITTIPNKLIDLGEVYSGQKIERIIAIKNTGNDTLRIQNIKPSCGCTSALLKNSNGVVAPSDTVQLSIVFNTKSQIGKVTKSVMINSNDSKNPKYEIKFTAFVLEQFKISPPMIVLYNQKGDSVMTGMVTLKNQDRSRNIKILGVNTKIENCTVSLKKKQLGPGEATQLSVEYRPAGEEFIRGTIEIITDLMTQNTFTIYVQKNLREE